MPRDNGTLLALLLHALRPAVLLHLVSRHRQDSPWRKQVHARSSSLHAAGRATAAAAVPHTCELWQQPATCNTCSCPCQDIWGGQAAAQPEAEHAVGSAVQRGWTGVLDGVWHGVVVVLGWCVMRCACRHTWQHAPAWASSSRLRGSLHTSCLSTSLTLDATSPLSGWAGKSCCTKLTGRVTLMGWPAVLGCMLPSSSWTSSSKVPAGRGRSRQDSGTALRGRVGAAGGAVLAHLLAVFQRVGWRHRGASAKVAVTHLLGLHACLSARHPPICAGCRRAGLAATGRTNAAPAPTRAASGRAACAAHRKTQSGRRGCWGCISGDDCTRHRPTSEQWCHCTCG